MTRIAVTELSKIPYLDVDSIGSRAVAVLTFHDGEKWDMWLPAPDKLIWMQGEPAESDYFGREPQAESDFYLEFFNLLAQRACWPDTLKHFGAIQCDIHNLAASLAKFELYHSIKDDRTDLLPRFVSTEIEYLFVVCRSLFDLLQETIAALWNRFQLRDGSIEKRNLPKSFRRMVIRDQSLMPAEEIADHWKLPEPLAQFYHRQGAFFEVLRRYRDNAIHGGVDSRFVFILEKGFALNPETEPFASFKPWTEDHLKQERLVSLRPVLAHLVLETLSACEDFSQTIQRITELPPEIAPGFRLFIRGNHSRHLLELQNVLAGSLWWDE